jgi:AcrR family transcriptional regulator
MSARSPKADRPRIPPRPTAEEAGADARERIIRTAYELFTRHGLAAVGVDRIVDESNVAKTTLYRHFRSKDDLILAVLDRHHQLWLRDWLQPKLDAAGTSATERLLEVFDSFEEWFGADGFNGCLFLNSVGETRDRTSAVRLAAIQAIEDVYVLLEKLTVEAGAREPQLLARQLQLLMRGTIAATTEGSSDAVHQAQDAARQLLEQAVPQQ